MVKILILFLISFGFDSCGQINSDIEVINYENFHEERGYFCKSCKNVKFEFEKNKSVEDLRLLEQESILPNKISNFKIISGFNPNEDDLKNYMKSFEENYLIKSLGIYSNENWDIEFLYVQSIEREHFYSDEIFVVVFKGKYMKSIFKAFEESNYSPDNFVNSRTYIENGKYVFETSPDKSFTKRLYSRFEINEAGEVIVIKD